MVDCHNNSLSGGKGLPDTPASLLLIDQLRDFMTGRIAKIERVHVGAWLKVVPWTSADFQLGFAHDTIICLICLLVILLFMSVCVI